MLRSLPNICRRRPASTTISTDIQHHQQGLSSSYSCHNTSWTTQTLSTSQLRTFSVCPLPINEISSNSSRCRTSRRMYKGVSSSAPAMVPLYHLRNTIGRADTDRLPAIHEFTETCFKKCIKGSISSGQLTGKENTCMTNCVNRFMDSNLAVLKHLEMMRAHQ